MAAETWCLDDFLNPNLDLPSPGEYLVGCLTGEYEGDEDSQGEAAVALLAASYAEAGLDPERAVDLAYDQISSGHASVSWDGSALSFDFTEDENE